MQQVVSDSLNEARYQAAAVEEQARADAAYAAHGLRAPARMINEDLDAYQRRLARPLQAHSSRWGVGVDLTPFRDNALRTVTGQIFSDAAAAAMKNDTPGQLRQVVSQDATGRRITRFYGDPEACWGPFKQASRVIIGWAK
jgi:hypothetical protein